jgi:predicted RNA-binding Zn ribbon-like protein
MSNPIESLSLDGGWPALDFSNTVSGRAEGDGEDYLHTWEDFVIWVRRTGLLPESEFSRWREQAEVEMAEVRGLREALFRLFRHYARTGRIDPDHLAWLNGYLHEVYVHTELRYAGTALVRTLQEDVFPEKPLWVIALSAEALLLSDRMPRVKECANAGCGWLFLDTSKNGTRRWCNMQSCGSQTKARNYYHRKKTEQLTKPG